MSDVLEFTRSLEKILTTYISVKHGPAKGNLTHALAYAGDGIRKIWDRRVMKRSISSSTEVKYDAQFAQDMKDTWKLCRIL